MVFGGCWLKVRVGEEEEVHRLCESVDLVKVYEVEDGFNLLLSC